MIGAPVEPVVAQHFDPLQLAAGQRAVDCAAGEIPLAAGGCVDERRRIRLGKKINRLSIRLR
jgi:hypothetical protein